MEYYLEKNNLDKIFKQAERKLLETKKEKFSKELKWRKEKIPNEAGIYAVFENTELIYIGESSNLRERMSDINRTYNHSLRKKLGKIKFKGDLVKNKYNEEVENKLDKLFRNNIYITFLKVNLGRLEIESHLTEKFDNQLYNSSKKRGVTTK